MIGFDEFASYKLIARQRRLLSPGFSISYLNGLEPLMLECIQALEEVLDAKCVESLGSATVDMNALLGNLASVSDAVVKVITRLADTCTGCDERDLFRWFIPVCPHE